jgi:hypothetical protein
MAYEHKKPFIFTQEAKFYGEPLSSAPGSSTAPALAPNGVHKLVAASTYVMGPPKPGSFVVLYSVGVDASVISKTSTGGTCAFNDMGTTIQRLNLGYDSTIGGSPAVMCVGESATQWRIIGVSIPALHAGTSNSVISVSTS